jgi:hypothetical protein
MIADAKYDKEKRKIEKRQAILQKAQASFNIVLDTAQAIMNVLKTATDPTVGAIMATATGILGGIELATVLSEPLPAYRKGVKGAKGGLSIMGEEGIELVKEPSGKEWLTSDEPTIYNLTKGSDVFPSDETQKILAQQAFNNSFNIISLSETNNLLKSINKNVKSDENIWNNGNFEYRKKGTRTIRYAVRRS